MKFIARDTRDHSADSIADRRFKRLKGKTIKKIILDKFLNQYGYDKGFVTANAIVDDLLITIEQYYRFSDKPVRKSGGDSDLINREIIKMQKNNFREILNVAFDGSFRMMSSFFNIGKEIPAEIEFKNLRFMSSSSSHIVSPATRRNGKTFATQLSNISFNGDYGSGEQECNIFIRQ